MALPVAASKTCSVIVVEFFNTGFLCLTIFEQMVCRAAPMTARGLSGFQPETRIQGLPLWADVLIELGELRDLSCLCVTKTPRVLFLLTLSPVLYRLYLLGLPSAESYSDPIYEGLEL